MAESIESLEFRRMARSNCYRYGCLEIYTTQALSLDKHNFPNYSTSQNGSAMEEFLSLIQGMGTAIGSNDPLSKLPRTLPTVKWEGDDMSLTYSLNGDMYFTDLRDYTSTKRSLRSMMLAQGWTINSNGPVTSYSPTMQGSSTLYTDDPMDAAGRAMMVNSMQHATAELEVLGGYMSGDTEMYASGLARKEARKQAEKAGLAGFGLIENLKAGYEAYSANTASGVMHNWQIAGHPLEFIVNGESIRKSVNCILRDAEFTESAFVIDEQGNSYPTKMSVSISLYNIYGALLTTMKINK